MKLGDRVLVYHSSVDPPHVAGVAKVARRFRLDRVRGPAALAHPHQPHLPQHPQVFRHLWLRQAEHRDEKSGERTDCVRPALR